MVRRIAHAQQLALCKEPIANNIVFLASYSVLLPAPGTRHVSPHLLKISHLLPLKEPTDPLKICAFFKKTT